MMRITKDKRKFNQLIDWRKQGDGWIESQYSFRHHAWVERQKPWGWSPWGQRKWEQEDLAYFINDLREWLESDHWDNPNWHRSLAFLEEKGILVKE